MKLFFDSDVLIWHLRGEKKALDFFKIIRKESNVEFWIGAIQRAEIVFFMRPNEQDLTMLFLSQFKTTPVDQHIVDLGGQLYREYNPRCGMDVNNALLAATVQRIGGIIYTLNTKHYPISNLRVIKAW